MQVKLELGEGKWLVFEDYGEKRETFESIY